MKRFLRALWTSIWCGDLTCAACGRRRVGFSHFCRQHTDEIMRSVRQLETEWLLRLVEAADELAADELAKGSETHLSHPTLKSKARWAQTLAAYQKVRHG